MKNSEILNMDEFERVNLQRCDGPFNCGTKTNLYWGVALAEEVGELAGAIKKLDRGFNKRELAKMRKKYDGKPEDMPTDEEFQRAWYFDKMKSIGHEAADIFICLNLLCQKNKLNLSTMVVQKFNLVSKEMELGPEYFLPTIEQIKNLSQNNGN